jgi:hypothetical protein
MTSRLRASAWLAVAAAVVTVIAVGPAASASAALVASSPAAVSATTPMAATPSADDPSIGTCTGASLACQLLEIPAQNTRLAMNSSVFGKVVQAYYPGGVEDWCVLSCGREGREFGAADADAAHQWRILTGSGQSGDARYFMMQNVATGQCLYSGSFVTHFPVSSTCSRNDPDFLWYVKPVEGTTKWLLVNRDGSCLGYRHGDPATQSTNSAVEIGTSQCNPSSSSLQFSAQTDQQARTFRDLALQYAFASCFDAAGKDTGACEFAPDAEAMASAKQVETRVCPSDPSLPFQNASNGAHDFTTTKEVTSSTTSSWKNAVKLGVSTDSLLGKVAKASAEYTSEFGGSQTDAYKSTVGLKYTVNPQTLYWVYLNLVSVPVSGTWTFDKLGGAPWTYHDIVAIPVQGNNGLSTRPVTNTAPLADFDRSRFSCTMDAPPIARSAPAVDVGRGSSAPRVGQTISVTNGEWNDAGDDRSFAYQWMRGSEAIVGATSKQLQVSEGDLGSELWARVITHRPGMFDGRADSPKTKPVQTAAPAVAPSAPPTTAPPVTTEAPAQPPSPTEAAAAGPAKSPTLPATAMTVQASSDQPSTIDDPVSFTVRVSSTVPGINGEVNLIWIDADGLEHLLDTAAVHGSSRIATATLIVPESMAAGEYPLTFRFVSAQATHEPSTASATVVVQDLD